MNADTDLALAITTCMMLIGLTHGNKNVILIIIKDLRADAVFKEIGGYPKIHTPHIDRLASKSLVFRNAFAQQSSSDVSISSILTGRRPQTFGIPTLRNDKGSENKQQKSNDKQDRAYHDTIHNHQTKLPDSTIVTLPKFFKDNGYSVRTIGNFDTNLSEYDMNDNNEHNTDTNNTSPGDTLSASWLEVDSKINLPDDVTINKTLHYIDYQKQKENFFLSVVFEKPGLPYKCPKDFFNLYSNSSIHSTNSRDGPDESLKNDAIPRYNIDHGNMPGILQYDDIRLNSAVSVRNGTLVLPIDVATNLKRAYYACVSYVDAMVGRILKRLESSGLIDDTIIALVGTRGIHLGEHGAWGGDTNFDVALHVPMILHIPRQTDAGKSIRALVELIDVFPTLVHSVKLGASVPSCITTESLKKFCHEGTNLLILLNDAQQTVKDGSFSQVIQRSPITIPTNPNISGTHFHGSVVRIVGYSIRTLAYRYTEWLQYNEYSGAIEWNNVVGAELYDHKDNDDELTNLAFLKSHKVIRQILSEEIREEWRDESEFNLSITGYVFVLIGTCYLMQSCAAMLET
ncbi:unnamed protein product [Owenia fusiformis]|uniref:Uncharacterized protein n=1 Tax=Owenia fusiformis TaxID=6347 RepID=A0A8J1YD22_OWEFU|nr:unnamed protein product [Owenia fusiformis]